MRALKIGLAVVLALAIAGGVFFKLVALGAGPMPEKARLALDLGALRTAAGALEACPESARADQVTRISMPGAVAIAGESFDPIEMGAYVWQLRYPDGTSVVLDPAHSKATHEREARGQPYDEAAWKRQEQALLEASVIAVTHEHFDHLGGVADSAHFETLGPKLKLNAAQRRPLKLGGVKRDLSGPATLESGPEGSLHPLAPCVVAVSAPGHTPGSQMFYVRLQGGAELLLIGDIAWQERNLERKVNRARLVGWLGEDSEAIGHQIRAIADFKQANPDVDVVVAHDIPAMERRFERGVVKRGLQGRLEAAAAREVAVPPALGDDAGILNVVLPRDGGIFVDGTQVDLPKLRELAAKHAARMADARATVTSDVNLPHERVEEVVEVLKAAGLGRLQIVGR
jgi:glyoxylase-like metal-dependent hydrolase (beta-lactamase superfamily II)/biopolymer transport protein ExbD